MKNTALYFVVVSVFLIANRFIKYDHSASLSERLDSEKIWAERCLEFQLKNLKKVYDAGIQITTGTDVGSPGILHGLSYINEMQAMQEVGIPAHDIILMTTQNGANLMQRDDIEVIDTNKIADLLILDKDPLKDISNFSSISYIMHNGKIIRGKSKIQ